MFLMLGLRHQQPAIFLSTTPALFINPKNLNDNSLAVASSSSALSLFYFVL
jgi:hypothetical protein